MEKLFECSVTEHDNEDEEGHQATSYGMYLLGASQVEGWQRPTKLVDLLQYALQLQALQGDELSTSRIFIFVCVVFHV